MENLKEKLNEFVRRYRNYNPYSLHQNIVEKTWNNGMGSLALFRFYPERELIVINESLCNKIDRTRLDEFCEQNGMKSWKRAVKMYAYPDYYFKAFSA